MGVMTDFARPDGTAAKGYLAMAGHDRPGVIVIQEWWGLNDQICGVADRFARAGYNALAPDLYKGRLTTEPDEANHLMTGLDFPAATHQDLRGAAPPSASTVFRPSTSPTRPRSAYRSRGTSQTRTIGAHRLRSTI